MMMMMMAIGGNGNGNDFTGMGGNGNSKSHSRTSLINSEQLYNTDLLQSQLILCQDSVPLELMLFCDRQTTNTTI